uniref:Uncharacterized protein n=1 Tax=Nelumbo nucifera TaxID=4432 RepID=A0A822ZAW6_NELNU|nr:TPA_asm: hypothetical protein HUJ06_000493 [Nelumbo nucifera]
MKKICMSELLGGQTLDQLLPVRIEEIKWLLRSILNKSEAGEAVGVRAELIRMTNNAEEVKAVVEEALEIAGTFNLSDYIGFCRNFDLQGLRKRFKDIHERLDRMMEMILREHEQVRGEKGMGDEAKDLLHILLDVAEAENSEMKLSRENIKAFILVK